MPLNIDFQQIFLHLFNFVVLFAILYFLLYKPVKNFMDQRVAYYKDLDEQAKKNLADAEQDKAEVEQRLAGVDQELMERRLKIRAEIDAAVEARLQRAEDEADRIIADARENITHERSNMIKKANKEITSMVITAAEKLVRQATTSEAFDEFLETAKRGEGNE